MQVHVLASGSTGNALFFDFDTTKILVDAGISARRIQQALCGIGTSLEEVDAILVTHEHRDHVSGLPTLTRRYGLPVYTRPGTWENMFCRELIPSACCYELGDSLEIGNVKIEAFSISHDAADPVGFNFYYRNRKYSVATDLGFVTDSVKKAIACSDVLVLESNHDVDMLKKGSYPWSLKRRIMSSRGHLSNTDAGWALARLPRKSKTEVFLAHLSQENNRPDLAKTTVSTILADQGCCLDSEITLRLTYPDRTASLVEDL
ncbi:beta-lactamase domain protein [Thermosinus carboxydivorans Nor1]|uniref:Beta-lactamase domain protein n=1 Tax=Thermosinus carboxydivorans Nor1 TaxID=401526 RepID=A1HNN2_9FIRM|nr:MBL fold metallo-hydrolase [Thermosinus carboxydivorans]EAX48391.1 beta-lactamase domain protein [Thermosinus carboxydivorans Nor1]